MPRIRSIKPSFFRSDDVAEIPWGPRLTWIGLWVYGDDDGRSIDDARLIKSDVWPLEDAVTIEIVAEHLEALVTLGRIRRYEVDGKRYLEVVNFSKHQLIKNRSKAGHPAPPWADSPNAPPGLPQSSANATPVLTTEVEVEVDMDKGGGGPPPRSCERHPNGTDSPCGDCRDARLTRDAWDKAHAAPSVLLPPRTAEMGSCTPGHHKWTIDGTCANCLARREAA